MRSGPTTWASAPPSVQFGELKAVRKEAERLRSWSWERAEDSGVGSAKLTLPPPKAYGTLGLEIRAPAGANIAVETTSDLSTWTETQRITGQGDTTPVKLILQPNPNVQAKFWRVRVR